MDLLKFKEIVNEAAAARGCAVVEMTLNDDDNVFEVVIDKENGDVDLSDCESVHRAVLDNFDRNIEDYALTVSSAGIDAAEADEILNTTKE
ncbi:MAG TPA: hypothetical protein DHU72_07010 [Rikenellaceae bacterium]|nr:hypothetical protein [Rikenellaceae bacterium]HBH20697.1 hypothetical protein [Rikenellaceae bacterium]HCZ23117.1 hypothetical protein [Rikenellaceae bacterium]